MKLSNKQQLFTRLVCQLLAKAFELGYEVTLGDAYRDPRLHGNVGESKGYGHSKSCHKLKLAIDLNLFKDGKYLDKTEDHKELGEYWEGLHELARWGGRFRDGNHYSFEHAGNK